MNINRTFSQEEVQTFIVRLQLLISFSRRTDKELVKAAESEPSENARRLATQLVWEWCSPVPVSELTMDMASQIPPTFIEVVNMVVCEIAHVVDQTTRESDAFWSSKPVEIDEPQVGDSVVFTAEVVPELRGPTVWVLKKISPAKPNPYRFMSTLQANTYFAAPRDVLTGVAVIRGTTRGVYR